jgi:predicted alpha/beta-fold hydrolase
VCHGINGGSHEGYCRWVCSTAVAAGWRAVVLNYRGCNGLPFTAARGYAATLTHDIFTGVYSVKA